MSRFSLCLGVALSCLASCQLFLGGQGAESCEEASFEAGCEGDVLLQCIEGLVIRVDCGDNTCDPIHQICGVCGDGLLSPNEQCDDGCGGDNCDNNDNGDGCDQFCQNEPGHFFEVEPNQSISEANQIPDPQRQAPILVHGAINPANDEDFFRFTLSVTSDVKLETFDTNPSLSSCEIIDTALSLLDSNGATLAQDDNDGSTDGFCSLIDPIIDAGARRLPAGTYFARVIDAGQNTLIPGYQLSISVTASCGDGGQPEGSEECDDGNNISGDGCDASCIIERCGDGVINNGGNEECDDGNNLDQDGCDASCVVELCGDGITQPGLGEECDDSNATSGDGCDSDCQLSCGNGVVDLASNEECDDANNTDLDGCESDCRLLCGAGTGATRATSDPSTGSCFLGFAALRSWPDAEADCELLGGHLAVISNSSENTFAVLAKADESEHWIGLNDLALEDAADGLPGDDFVWVNGEPVTFLNFGAFEPDNFQEEDCVNLIFQNTAWQDTDCALLRRPLCELEADPCGDGIIQPTFGEACDDGNNADGDLCSADCSTGCGDGVVQALLGEACDDGNLLDGDGCDSNCTPTGCGNDVLIAGELCFSPPPIFRVGEIGVDGQLDALAAGDLDGDLDLDIVTADTAQELRVLLGDGGGNFVPGGAFPLPSSSSVALADMDEDGDLDVMAANGLGFVSLLKNQGDGDFDARIDFASGGIASAIAVADLDGDQDLDVAVTHRLNDSVSILLNQLNQGVVSFAPPITLPTQDEPGALALGDLDGDLDSDLDVFNFNPTSGTSAINIFLNQGAGVFALDSSFSGGSPNSPRGYITIALGDIDGDGASDLLVPDFDNNTVDLFRNQGDGSFLPEEALSGGLSPVGVTLGDFNGDQDLDLAVANHNSLSVSLLFNQSGSFTPGIELPSFLPVALTSGDFDGDLDLDIAAGVLNVGVDILENQGGGNFTPPVLAAGALPSSVALEDLDGDSDLDLLVTNAGNGSIGSFLNLGGGVFDAQRTFQAAFAQAARLGDMNGDAIPDVVTNGDFVSVLLGRGDGSFDPALQFGSASGVSLALGDLDGDSDLDVVGDGRTFDHLPVFLNQGDGTLVAGPLLPHLASFCANGIALGDLDNDADLDIAVSNQCVDQVDLFLNQGGATFAAFVSLPGGASGADVEIADINGDGLQDLSVANFGSQTISILLNQGGASFAPQSSIPVLDPPVALALGDLDNDGLLDLVSWSTRVEILRNLGGGTFSSSLIFPMPAVVDLMDKAAALGDISGDGALDLVIANPTEDTVTLIFANP